MLVIQMESGLGVSIYKSTFLFFSTLVDTSEVPASRSENQKPGSAGSASHLLKNFN